MPEKKGRKGNMETNYSSVKMSSDEKPHLILQAVRDCDSKRLRELLEEQTAKASNDKVYPGDYKYHFKDLMEKDEEGRTALHRAASVTDEDISLDLTTILLNSKQVLVSESFEGTVLNKDEKLNKLVNCRDNNGEIGIIRAIENQSPKVVLHLLRNRSDVLEKNVAGMEVLKLIYLKAPDAIERIYDETVLLCKDRKCISIYWGALIGFHEIDQEEGTAWKETEYLSGTLSHTNNEVAKILLHPIIKLFLHIKWKKIRPLFVASFTFHLLWLGLYAASFILLQESTVASSNETANETQWNPVADAVEPFKGHSLWVILIVVAVIIGIKEAYQLYLLGWAYCVLENIVQVSFIVLYMIQYCFLVSGHTHTGCTISIIGVFLMTVLVILEFGKIPFFGAQVGAMKKVITTCLPHFPLLILWCTGFGLIFWALFFKDDKDFSALGIPARIAAMGTGELEAKDMLEKALHGSGTFRDFVCVVCFLLFTVFVVTLHFNLLIGYAVSDIQALGKEAEALELYNRLSTIFTIESFLFTAAQFFRCPSMMKPLYVFPPSAWKQTDATKEMKRIPVELQRELHDFAFRNFKEKRKEFKLSFNLNK